ncbi:hypothetical protein [Aliiglaciecola sp. NS0011-25]|uniref:hypothetical protein n=1 Tax=Aliiglaciecola sp. NS0011-25 TaxID=3127654 RepID=UPI00333E4905
MFRTDLHGQPCLEQIYVDNHDKYDLAIYMDTHDKREFTWTGRLAIYMDRHV